MGKQAAALQEKPFEQIRKETLDQKYRRIAKLLDQLGVIYVWYGALDGLNLSYSTLKYFFDIFYTNTKNSSTDMMHNWAMTPAGIAVAALESVGMIVFSMLGNLFKDKDKNFLKRYIAITWPYVRDTVKGLKNSYKGLRSLLYTIHELGGKNLNFMMVPLALVFGAFSVLNRIWYRQMKNGRKQMQDDNAKRREEILKEHELHTMLALPEDNEPYINSYIWIEDKALYFIGADGAASIVPIDAELLDANIGMLQKKADEPIWLSKMALDRLLGDRAKDNLSNKNSSTINDEINYVRDKDNNLIKRQTKSTKRKGLISATYGGFIDGLYMYMGVYSLAAVMPPAFIVISVFSTLYVVTNMIARIYEEYDYQQKLEISAAKVELALSIKGLKSRLYDCQKLFSNRQSPTSAEIDIIFNELGAARESFKADRQKIQNLQTVSNRLAFLSGLKNGLSAYGVIASFLFAIGTILLLAGVAFPPALLFAGVIFGMVCLIGFTVHSLIHYSNERKMQRIDDANDLRDPCVKDLDRLIAQLNQADWEKDQEKERRIDELVWLFEDKGLVVDSSPQLFFQEWFEMFRSFFSGASKGVKAVDHVLNPLEEQDSSGHYHESTIMIVVIFVSAILNSIVLALRALARGFSRSAADDVPYKDAKKIIPPSSTVDMTSYNEAIPKTLLDVSPLVNNDSDIDSTKSSQLKSHSRRPSGSGFFDKKIINSESEAWKLEVVRNNLPALSTSSTMSR